MNIPLDEEFAWRLLISFFIGTIIGFEREYRSKAAGLRTMIMICLGSTMFTEISILLGGNTNGDRIAAAIVTGIGFLGAGVIFKDGVSVTGITTATTIWISAALGMAVGAGEYFISALGLAGVLIVLAVFERFKYLIERMHHSRTYKICFDRNAVDENHLNIISKELKLDIRKVREMKEDRRIIFVYEVSGKAKELESFSHYLREDEKVKEFEC